MAAPAGKSSAAGTTGSQRDPALSAWAKRIAGITPQRPAPTFAPASFQDQWRYRTQSRPQPGEPNTVLLWPDTFTNHFHPHIARAAVDVLQRAGLRVAVPTRQVCCGLTWISTGQLRTAQAVLRRTLRILRPWLEAGTPIVGLEPSCTAVFRSDIQDLLPHDEDAHRIRTQFHTFAEALTRLAPRAAKSTNIRSKALVQTHCHQHAILGFDADLAVMHDAGIDAEVLDSGCCGLAGNFGFENGHYDLSMACAERVLLPAVRTADTDTLILADGFSCRTQIEHGAPGNPAQHLAEVLQNLCASQACHPG